MAFLWIFAASVTGAIVNLFTKRNLERIGSAQGYLVIYFFFSLISALFIHPQVFHISFSWEMFLIGALAGFLNFLMMLFLTQALKFGPPGITFAFQNAGAILPGALLFFLFGKAFGFVMTPTLIGGLICVLAGLFWAPYTKGVPKDEEQFPSFKKWILFALATFAAQGLALSLFQYRCLLLHLHSTQHALVFAICEPQADLWFMPGLFITATTLNAAYFFYREKRGFRLPELFYGLGSGFLNGVGTYSLLFAALLAKPLERGVIFPLFAILVIFFSSLWAKKLYQEKVNWKAIFLCMLGILIASL